MTSATVSLILQDMREVGAEQGKVLPELSLDLPLLECGLDSLCIAILVARLEDQLGIDPFSADSSIAFPVTIGDFVQAYERASA